MSVVEVYPSAQRHGFNWPRWRRDRDGWRTFVTYSRREPEGLLTYMHWAVAANLSPRDGPFG
jgi:hypothetical protein